MALASRYVISSVEHFFNTFAKENCIFLYLAQTRQAASISSHYFFHVHVQLFVYVRAGIVDIFVWITSFQCHNVQARCVSSTA